MRRLPWGTLAASGRAALLVFPGADVPRFSLVTSPDGHEFDPLLTYLRNVEEYGSHDVFLLESKGGPAADSRETVIGILGPLVIGIREDRVTVEAPEALRHTVEQTLQRCDVMDADGVVRNRDSVWRIPELIFADLEFDATPEGFNGFFVNIGYDGVFYAEDMQRRIPAAADTGSDIEYRIVISTMRVPADGRAMTVSSISGPHWGYRPVIPAYGSPGSQPQREPLPEFTFHDEMTRGEFISKVEICKDHIRAGDIYQVQIGHKIDIRSSIRPVEVYRRLRERNPSPYLALARGFGGLMLVASPELFVRKEGARASMRPIAGTVRKTEGTTRESAHATLLADEKECAEHIMLVDLCRNDLGRVAEYGSLCVPELMVCEEYSHLYHMVSEVQIAVREPFDVYDAIEATFPAGTVTGAPKVRAMEIIEELELSRREYYAGAFGLVPFTGDCVLGLSIRMMQFRDGTYTVRASAGIVADSDPSNEWRETLTKMSATFWAITGEELLDYA